MAAINLSKADRVPVVPQITYATSQLLGIKFHEAMTDAPLMARALWAGYELLKYDGVYVGWESSFNLVAEALGCRLRIVEDGNPSVVEVAIKRPQDLKGVRLPDPERDGRLPVYLKALDILKAKVKGEIPLFSYVPGPLTLSGIIYGTERLMLDLIKNPEFVHELNEITARVSEDFAVAKAEHGANVIVIADPTASTSLISPDMFQEFSLLYLRRVLHAIKGMGAVPSLHICGKTGPILENMAKTEAKVLEVDSPVDLREAKGLVGGRTCLMGNVDTAVLLRGKPHDVELETRDCIKKAADGGGFILSSGCEVPLNTPMDNIKAMVKAAKKYGTL